jgi:hypothetical protein
LFRGDGEHCGTPNNYGEHGKGLLILRFVFFVLAWCLRISVVNQENHEDPKARRIHGEEPKQSLSMLAVFLVINLSGSLESWSIVD